jgi:hypothetical protein
MRTRPILNVLPCCKLQEVFARTLARALRQPGAGGRSNMKQLLLLVCSFAVVWSGTLIAQTQSPLPSSSQPQSSSPAPSGAQAQAPGSQSLHATSWSGTLADATCK